MSWQSIPRLQPQSLPPPQQHKSNNSMSISHPQPHPQPLLNMAVLLERFFVVLAQFRTRGGAERFGSGCFSFRYLKVGKSPSSLRAATEASERCVSFVRQALIYNQSMGFSRECAKCLQTFFSCAIIIDKDGSMARHPLFYSRKFFAYYSKNAPSIFPRLWAIAVSAKSNRGET